jgi:chromate reductase
MPESPILIISGTNRPDSHTFRVASVILKHYQDAKLAAEIYSLSDLPREIFEPTSYATKPSVFLPVQQRVVDAAGLHVVTPEYNGSFPGVLKYFIDMLKFPESFQHKPVAFVGVANGVYGALRPVEQLQQIFGYRNAHIFPDRVFVPGARGKFSPESQLIDADINTRLVNQAVGFAKFAKRLKD